MNIVIKPQGLLNSKWICFTFFLTLCLGTNLLAQQKQNEGYLRYIDKFKNIAISEMERAGVPASIKLAQGLLESGAGKSTLAREAGNHFGMKCGYGWKGKTYYREDDDYDQAGNLIKSCFRVFKDPESSYIAHSEFLRDPRKNQRYGFLFQLDPKDYRLWARGLKEAGYATNPNYPKLLINLIENYELFVYDNMTSSDPDVADVGFDTDFIIGENIKVNGARVALAKVGESVEDISVRTFTPLKNILKFNEQLASSDQVLDEDYRVFLQPKRGAFRGKKKYHYVKGNETMFDISQLYGVKIAKLYKKNRLNIGVEPAVGERIKIRGWRIPANETPKARGKNDKVKQLNRIPSKNKNKDQDPEIEFDTDNPATSIDDFESTASNDGSLIPDDLTNPNNTSNNNPNTGVGNNTGTTTTNPSNNPNNAVEGGGMGFHVVQDGDTLYRLSKKYGITVREIKKINGMDSNIISLGQRIRIR